MDEDDTDFDYCLSHFLLYIHQQLKYLLFQQYRSFQCLNAALVYSDSSVSVTISILYSTLAPLSLRKPKGGKSEAQVPYKYTQRKILLTRVLLLEKNGTLYLELSGPVYRPIYSRPQWPKFSQFRIKASTYLSQPFSAINRSSSHHLFLIPRIPQGAKVPRSSTTRLTPPANSTYPPIIIPFSLNSHSTLRCVL